MNNNEILNELKNIQQTMLNAELVKGQYMPWALIEKMEQGTNKLEEHEMIKVILAEGGTYIGQDARDIIIQLKLEDWTRYDNVESYQKNIARRVMVFKNEQIQFSNDMEFLQGLKRIGFIKELTK